MLLSSPSSLQNLQKSFQNHGRQERHCAHSRETVIVEDKAEKEHEGNIKGKYKGKNWTLISDRSCWFQHWFIQAIKVEKLFYTNAVCG